jgi:hypothetical protein
LPARIGVGPVKTPVRDGVTSNVGQSRASAVAVRAAGPSAAVSAGEAAVGRG